MTRSKRSRHEFTCPSGLIADLEDQLNRERCDLFAAEAGRRLGERAIPIARAMAEKARTWEPDFDVEHFFREVQTEVENDGVIDLSDERSNQFH